MSYLTDLIEDEIGRIAGGRVYPPKIHDFYNGWPADIDFWYQPQPRSQLLIFDPVIAGGGGGGGTNDVKPGSLIPGTSEFVHSRFALYGNRGGDTLLLAKPPVPARLVRGSVTRLEFNGPHGMVPGQPFFIVDAIPGYKEAEPHSQSTRRVAESLSLPWLSGPQEVHTHQFTTFYSRAQENWTDHGFEICREPYNPPFSYAVFPEGWRDIYYPDPTLPFQRPIELGGGELNVSVWTSWYGVPGGSGGGEIGDNGGPGGSPWGFHLPGPSGHVQGRHIYTGSSDVIWNGGGRGAHGPLGGAGGSQCSGEGNNAADGTGGGGGGAAPGVTPGDGRPPSNPGCWGMGGGGAGIGAKVWFKPEPIEEGSEIMKPIWFRVGKRGMGGKAGTNGFKGGMGSLGVVTIQDWGGT